MNKVKTVMVAFCYEQARYIELLDKFKIGNILGFHDEFNEITGNIDCTAVTIIVPKFLEKKLQIRLNGKITDEGRIRRQRLINQGKVC